LLTTVKALAERLHRKLLGLDIAHLLEAPSKSGDLWKIHAFRLLLKEVTAS
jgi:hypothetical protein